MIELGGNDGLRALPVDADARQLAKMIDLSTAAGAEVLLLGMRMPPNYGPEYTEKFRAVFRGRGAREKSALGAFPPRRYRADAQADAGGRRPPQRTRPTETPGQCLAVAEENPTPIILALVECRPAPSVARAGPLPRALAAGYGVIGRSAIPPHRHGASRCRCGAWISNKSRPCTWRSRRWDRTCPRPLRALTSMPRGARAAAMRGRRGMRRRVGGRCRSHCGRRRRGRLGFLYAAVAAAGAPCRWRSKSCRPCRWSVRRARVPRHRQRDHAAGAPRRHEHK